jgi:hypothetical protein
MADNTSTLVRLFWIVFGLMLLGAVAAIVSGGYAS